MKDNTARAIIGEYGRIAIRNPKPIIINASDKFQEQQPETRKIESIEGVLEASADGNSMIFTDSLVINKDQSDFYKDHVFYIKQFSKLDLAILEGTKENFDFMMRWITNKQVYAVKEVIEERERFTNILREKVEFLNNNEIRRTRLKHGTNFEDEYEYETKLKKELLENILFESEEINRKSNNSIIRPKYPEILETIKKFAIEMTSGIGFIKRNFERRYNESYRKASDLHGDEGLAAAALYYSIFENKQCFTVTNDSDIPRIIGSIHHILIENNEGQNDDMLGRLRKNPINAYFLINDRLHLNYSTSRPNRGVLFLNYVMNDEAKEYLRESRIVSKFTSAIEKEMNKLRLESYKHTLNQ